MPDITDDARRLFAEVVEKCWNKCPELVVPGWRFHEKRVSQVGAWYRDVPEKRGVIDPMARDVDILAAAALCAEFMQRRLVQHCRLSDEDGQHWCLYNDGGVLFDIRADWPSAQFAAVLAEERE